MVVTFINGGAEQERLDGRSSRSLIRDTRGLGEEKQGRNSQSPVRDSTRSRIGESRPMDLVGTVAHQNSPRCGELSHFLEVCYFFFELPHAERLTAC